MRTSSLVLLVVLMATAVSCIDLTKWDLKWADEFNGNSLDKSKWENEVWCQGGNQELQCYTTHEKNLKVADGMLTITAVQESISGSLDGCTGVSKYGKWVCTLKKDYSSARIRTRNAVGGAWQFGRFEARARLPDGKHLWPALWLLPRDESYGGWAASGEIDIMEARGQATNKISGAIHYGGASPNNAHSGSNAVTIPGIDNFSTSWHTFAVEWNADKITWFVDDHVFMTQSLVRNFWSGKGKNPYTKQRAPFDKPFYFLINLAVGGGFFGGYGDLTTAQAHQWKKPTLDVDYVRVYTPKSGTVVPQPTKTSAKTSTSKATTAKTSTTKTSAKPTTTTKAATSTTKAATTTVTTKCNGATFDAKKYTCAVDAVTKKSVLCPLGNSACNGGCYSTTKYSCTNGALKPK
jgi:beta-glucanase (GH16 family)